MLLQTFSQVSKHNYTYAYGCITYQKISLKYCNGILCGAESTTSAIIIYDTDINVLLIKCLIYNSCFVIDNAQVHLPSLL